MTFHFSSQTASNSSAPRLSVVWMRQYTRPLLWLILLQCSSTRCSTRRSLVKIPCKTLQTRPRRVGDLCVCILLSSLLVSIPRLARSSSSSYGARYARLDYFARSRSISGGQVRLVWNGYRCIHRIGRSDYAESVYNYHKIAYFWVVLTTSTIEERVFCCKFPAQFPRRQFIETPFLRQRLGVGRNCW